MSEWISIEDKLPPFDVEVLVYQPSWKGEPVTTSTLRAIDSSGYRFQFKNELNRYSVTHWMPLPEPPK